MCILKRVLSTNLFIDGHCPSDSQNKDLYHDIQMMKKNECSKLLCIQQKDEVTYQCVVVYFQCPLVALHANVFSLQMNIL